MITGLEDFTKNQKIRVQNLCIFWLFIIKPSETLEQSVILAIKANDEQTLKTLYIENYGKVLQHILQHNGSEEQAKDIYQDTFIAVWRNIQAGKFKILQNSSLGAYIFQVAKHKWLDHLRSVNVKKTILLQEQHENMMSFDISNDINTERLTLVRESFKKLGNSCRDLLSKFYYQKQSLKDIASALDITEATAKNNKYRCMEKLRAMVNQ